MKTLIIVSRCLKVTKLNPEESWYEFHFKGVCAGEALKKVTLRARHDFCLSKGEEYLLYVQLLEFKQGILRGMVLKVKPLEECWNKS